MEETIRRSISGDKIDSFRELFSIVTGAHLSQVEVHHGDGDAVGRDSDGRWSVELNTEGELWEAAHELGHVLFSPFDYSKAVAKALQNQDIHTIANILEDSRIDRKASEHFGKPLYELHRNELLSYSGNADNLADAMFSAAFQLDWEVEGRDPEGVVKKFGKDIRKAVMSDDRMAAIRLAVRIAYYLNWLDGEEYREPEAQGNEPSFRSDYSGKPSGHDPKEVKQSLEKAEEVFKAVVASQEMAKEQAKRDSSALKGQSTGRLKLDDGTGETHEVTFGIEADQVPIVMDKRVNLALDEYSASEGNRRARKGKLDVRRAWKVNTGNLRVFQSPEPTKGRTFVMLDSSGSMGRPETERTNMYLAFQIAGAIARSFPDTEVMAYSAKYSACDLYPIQAGMMFSDEAWGRITGGTPSCTAMMYIRDRMLGNLEDVAIVFVTDGGSNACNDHYHAATLRKKLRASGARFVEIGVGGYRSGYDEDGLFSIESMNDIGELKNVMAELRKGGE
jgi:hypothetical protein